MQLINLGIKSSCRPLAAPQPWLYGPVERISIFWQNTCSAGGGFSAVERQTPALPEGKESTVGTTLNSRVSDKMLGTELAHCVWLGLSHKVSGCSVRHHHQPRLREFQHAMFAVIATQP